MARASDAANFFIDAAQRCDAEPMTNLRLQKLMYFAQAWSIVRNGCPLFDEELRAWELGPVVPSVYQKYKICGGNPIADADDAFDYSVFTEEELSVLTDVFVQYGKFTTAQLVNLCHRPGEPWEKTARNGVITKACMKDAFLRKTPLSGMGDILSNLPEEGYHDESGRLVLPSDWER